MALLALARKGSGRAPRFILSVLAIQVALNAVYDIRVLFLVNGRSDAETMARLFLRAGVVVGASLDDRQRRDARVDAADHARPRLIVAVSERASANGR